MVLVSLEEFKGTVTEGQFKDILSIVTDDIKFNKISYRKKTSPREFIELCKRTKNLLLRV